MPFYCLQVSYTGQEWDQLLHSTEEPFEAIRLPIEKLGGHLRCSYFTLGVFDALAIVEFPHAVSTADIAVAFSSGGAVAEIRLVPLLDASEVSQAASHAGYHRYYPTANQSYFVATAAK